MTSSLNYSSAFPCRHAERNTVAHRLSHLFGGRRKDISQFNVLWISFHISLHAANESIAMPSTEIYLRNTHRNGPLDLLLWNTRAAVQNDGYADPLDDFAEPLKIEPRLPFVKPVRISDRYCQAVNACFSQTHSGVRIGQALRAERPNLCLHRNIGVLPNLHHSLRVRDVLFQG